MNRLFLRSLCAPALVAICICGWLPQSQAQISSLASPSKPRPKQPEIRDGWIIERDEQAGLSVHTRELVLVPKAEPQPALKYHLIGNSFELREGNAAIYYLKALGFLEQTSAREKLTKFHREASARAEEEGKEYSEVPPEVWRGTAPNDLPLDEVKEYLTLTSFQPQFIREAAKRDLFDLNRNFREVDDPIGYLLPEIQTMRSLARTQSLRIRVAIAENRIDNAIEIIGQQFAMARHLGQDEFLVSNLVGIAIAGIAWNDAFYLLEHADTPNLYWAFASMPTPLVDTRHSMATEREFLYQQIKVLREVDETPRPAGYWKDFVERLGPQIGFLAYEMDLDLPQDDPQLLRASLVGMIAGAYPGAKEYLIKECKLPPEQVEACPTTQVVFLAMVRFYDQWRDETFKWTHVPFWQFRAMSARERVDGAMREASMKYGLCSAPANLLLPAIQAVRTAEARCNQTIALIQTVEAIRMYGAAHNGKLPPSLDDLPVPAPVEPFTGKPLGYERSGSRAVLTGHSMPGIRYRLVVRFAKQ